MSRHLLEELQFNSREALMAAQPVPAGQESGGLSVRKLVEAVFRGRWLVIGLTALGFFAGAYLAVTTPNSYVSRGQFMFTQSGSESISVDPSKGAETRSESISLNATYIFNAEQLLLNVVRKVTPERILAPYSPGQDDKATGLKGLFHRLQTDWSGSGSYSEDDALKRLKRGLVVDKPRYSDVLLVSYSANDEHLAQDVLAAYMDAAIQWHLAVYDEPKRFEQVEKNQVTAAATWETAKKALKTFETNNAVQNFDFELGARRAEELEYASAMHKNEADIESLKMQIASQQEALQILQPTRPVKRMFSDSESRKGLEAEKTRLIIARASVQSRVTDPEHDPEVAELTRKIDILTEALRTVQESQLKAPLVEYDEENPEYREAQIALAQSRVKLIGAESVKKTYEARHEKSQNDVNKLVQLQPEYRRLEDALKRAEEEATHANDALAVANRKRLLKEGNFSSLQRIEPASLPLEKEGPNRMKQLMGGLFAGLFLALGLVILRALPDNVVRVREDLERLGGAPVIGVVPRLTGRNVRRHQVRRDQGW
jgi:uncharacterized protein involved in exopolysaccharide biosynthesis